MKTKATILCAVLAASTVAQAQSTHSTAHVPSLSQQEMGAWAKLNQQWRIEQRDRLVAEGFCSADELPVEAATACNWRAFGYPQMGSSGGSE